MPLRQGNEGIGKILEADMRAVGMSVRALARGMAGEGATDRKVETERRALNKYIHNGKLPEQPRAVQLARLLGQEDDRYVRTIDRRDRLARQNAALEQENQELRDQLRRLQANVDEPTPSER